MPEKTPSPYPRGFRLEHNPGRPKPYRAVMPVDGKRSRESFATEADAKKALEAAVKTHLKHGAPAVEWDAAAHREWKEARRLIEGHKVTLPEIAAFWLNHGARDCPKMPVPEAVAVFIADKEAQGRSERHTYDLKNRLESFAPFFAKTTVEIIDAESVLAWVKAEGGKPRSQKNNLVAAMNFLNYARRRGWTDKVPEIHESDLPKITKPTKEILTLKQARAFFAWAETNRPQWCAFFAISAFAGIRAAEGEQFRSEWINFTRKRITIPKEICKTGDDWVLVGLPDNVWAWLKKYRFKGAIDFPTNRKAITMRTKLVEAKILPKWPDNGFRHSFATYHISLLESADKTALLTRHKSAAMLWQSYLRHLTGKPEATAYFSIKPGK